MTESQVQGRKKHVRPPLKLDVDLGEWTARGAVEARVNERRVSIDRGIPGERATVQIDRHRGPWRGIVQEVLDPSPERIIPPCPHYLQGCGGCQIQHLGYAAQVVTKRELVDRDMVRAGTSARVGDVYVMDDPWRYRRTAAIAIGWEAGFRPRGRRGIVEIHDCLISHPLIGRLSHQLNEYLREGRLPNYHGRVWLDCTVVGSERDLQLQVIIQGIAGLTLETHPELPEVAKTISSLDGIATVAYRHRTGEPRPLIGDLTSTIQIADRSMTLPTGSFSQTNLGMVNLVLQRMVSALANRSIRQAADIYGGIGTFALALSEHVETMTLVELDAAAVAAAQQTASAWGLTNVTFVSALAEKALPELAALDLAVVDPPRSGLGQSVVDALLTNAPPLLFYVSCAPSTLARDVALLEAGGYQTQALDLFDFYPHTYHVESLAVLTR